MSVDWYQLLGVGDQEPAPAPQPDYSNPPPAPAPQPAADSSGYDWYSSLGVDNPQPSQPSAYDTMTGGGYQQPQQNYDPFAGASASAQMYGGQPDYNPIDYASNVWNAFTAPFQQPTKQDMNPLEWIGDTANKAITGGLGAFGEALKPAGGGIDQLADSNIPGLNVAAGAVRNAWEQVAEPAGNFATSEYGALSRGGNVLDMLHGAGPGGWLIGGAFDLMQGRDPTQYYKDVAGNLPQVQLGEAALDPNKRAEFDQLRNQAMQDAYNQIIQSGGTVDQANAAATREGMKLVNPLNLAEYQGEQDFSKLPSYVQLPIMFSKGVINPGNLAYETAIGGPHFFVDKEGGLHRTEVPGSQETSAFNYMQGIPAKAIGAAANGLVDVTGTRPIFDALGNAIEGPQKFLARTENDLKTTQQLLTIAEQTLGDSESAQRAVFLDPNSEFYWQNYDIRPDIANKAAESLGVIDKYAQEKAGVQEPTQNPQDVALPQNETDLARRAQDTSPGAEKTLFDEAKPEPTNQYTPAQPDTRPATLPEQISYALQDYKEARIQELQKANPGAAMFDLNEKAKAEAEAFRPELKTAEDVANFRAEQGITDNPPVETKIPTAKDDFMKPTPQPPDVAINDIHRAAGIPDLNPTHGELLDFVKKQLGYERKAYKLEGPVGKLKLRETQPLEQFGTAGKLLNKFASVTMPYMGRAFLNKQGRAIRDTASNLVKYVAEGFGRRGDTADRFERVHAMAGMENPAETLPMGKASSLADIGGKEARGGTGKELLFHVLNPFDELSSDLMRAVSKGKIKDWNDFTEKAEANMKTFAYKNEFLKQWDKAIDDRVRAGALDPTIAAHLKDGTLTEATVRDFMAQKMPKGASLDDVAKGIYNPQNYSDALRARYDKLFGDRAGEIGKVVKNGVESLQDRVDQYNKEQRQEFLKVTKNMDPDSAEYKTALATYRQTRPLDIHDVIPGHPIWEQMKADVFKQLDVANAAAKIQEDMDPAIRAAVRDQIIRSFDWAENQKRIDGLKTFLENRIATREKAGEFDKYNRAAPRPAEPAEKPQAAHSGYTQRFPNNVEKMKLKGEILKYGRDTKNGIAADTAIRQLDKPDPTKIIVRSDRADGPHFRVTTPDKIGDNGQNEHQVWPIKAAEAEAPSMQPSGNTSRDRILRELKATGYNEQHALAGMKILDAMAESYEQRTGRSRNDVYDRIGFQKGEEGKVAPGALEQTAEVRRLIDEQHAQLGYNWGFDYKDSVPAEIAGAREVEGENNFRRFLRRWETEYYASLGKGAPRTRQEMIDRFVEGAFEELKYQMALNPEKSGLTWYTDTWENAMKTIRETFPEIKSDQGAERLFKLFTGLTSQGTGVLPNIKKAMMAFNRFADSGRIRATKADAGKFVRRELGLTTRNLDIQRDYIVEHMPDWTDLSYESPRLVGKVDQERDELKQQIKQEGVDWLVNHQKALGISVEAIPALRDLLTSERYVRDPAAAFEWLKRAHPLEDIIDNYRDMVKVEWMAEAVKRTLEVEYEPGQLIPGSRVLGPRPEYLGMETDNFLKLVDLTKKGFNNDIEATLDWLTSKHSEAEFRVVAELLFQDQGTRDNLLSQVRKAIRDDLQTHTRLGDVPANYAGGEYGSRIFGPKVGNFIANLFGGGDRTTKDLWFTTTWNRLMGILENDSTPFKTQPLPAQRVVMDDAMYALMNKLRDENIHIDMSTAQALLWFYEKQLAEAHGRVGSGSKSADYSTEVGRGVQELAGNKVDDRKGAKPNTYRPDPNAPKIITPGRETPSTYRRVSTGERESGPSTGLDRAAYEAEMNRRMLPQEAGGKKILGTTDLDIAANGKYLISIFKEANASTLPHELAHVFRQFLPDDMLKIAQDFVGNTDGKWTVPQEEMFARGFERYLRDGKAPTPALAAVFQQFRDWLQKIYRIIKGGEIDVKLTPEIRQVFDQMLGGTKEEIQARRKPKAEVQEINPGDNGLKPFDEFLMDHHYDPEHDSHEEYLALKKEWDGLRDQAMQGPAQPKTANYKATVTSTTIPNQAANPNVAYNDRLPLERNLRKQAFDNGGSPRNIDKVRATDLKSRTDGKAYMTRLFDAARKDGLTDEQINRAAGKPTVLSQEAAEHTPEELAGYDRAINAPSGIRLDVGDGKQGQVVAPNTIRKYVADWNRGRRPGDLVDQRLSKDQKRQYARDIMATDEFIRRTTGNTFKLDLNNFTPVRISDGKSLDELLGRTRQSNIGEAKPEWPKGEPPNTVEKVVKEVEDYFGKDAYKTFANLKKEKGQVAVDMAYSDLARRLDFPDPTVPNTPTQKMGAETSEARKAIAALEADARDRYNTAQQKKGENLALDEAKQQTRDSLDSKIHTDMAHMLLDADRAAYKRIEGVYFDYRNKNVLDQMMGSILPFNYWTRRNFAYVARYFAANPVQFAAILQFYKNVEQENQKAGGIAPYNMGNILLWTNPDGSKVQANISSFFPFNPTGNSDSLLQLIDATDAENGDTVNKTPLAMLFGADRYYKGKVTGRDKGLIPTFLSPNPVIDILLKTGVPNDFAKKLGIVTDGFGSPDPSDKRAMYQTTGLVAGRTAIRDISARLGVTSFIRDQLAKVGIKMSDLDLEGPLNDLVFGTNAGKPLTAVYQELTEMAQGDPKHQEQYLLALAKLKQGNWTPEALKALDTVESQGAWQRAASMAGFVSVVNNTPRQQLAQNLGAGYAQVAGDKGHYETTSVDPKTGYETKKFVPGGSQEFFKNNPGAEVAFDKNKTPDKIIEGIGDNKTSQALADLNKAYYDDKKISLAQYNKGLDDLKAGNPTFFKVEKDKAYQQAKGELPYLPGQTHKSVAEVDQQYAKQEIPSERKYAEYKDTLYRAEGSGRYQELAQKINDLYNSGQKAAASALSKSPEYVALKAARDAVNAANPVEAARKKAEDEAKYGPSPSSSTTGSTGSGSSASSAPWTAAQKSLYGRLLGQGYSKAAATAAVNKAGSGGGGSGGSTKKTYTTSYKSTGSTGGGSASSTSNWDAAQKKLYGTLIAKGYSKAAAASVVNKQQSTSTPAPTGAATTFGATTSISKLPATTAGTGGTTSSTWDSVQKKAYALALADGYSKSYATTVANKIGSGESTGYKSKLTGAVASYGSNKQPVGSSTKPATALPTSGASKTPGAATPATSSDAGSFWQRNANGDIEAAAQDMIQNGWRGGASGYSTYGAAYKVALQEMASQPDSIRVVIFNPDNGSYGIWQKGTMSMSQDDDALLRSETIANANSARYTNVRSGGGGGGGSRRSSSSSSSYIHPPVSPWRVASPYSGTLNRMNRGRKF